MNKEILVLETLRISKVNCMNIFC